MIKRARECAFEKQRATSPCESFLIMSNYIAPYNEYECYRTEGNRRGRRRPEREKRSEGRARRGGRRSGTRASVLSGTPDAEYVYSHARKGRKRGKTNGEEKQ